MYIAIDLKSFYASVECVERGLEPLETFLVVADASRTTKTICLAVSPALKALGVPGRPRLFEVIQKVREINYHRRSKMKGAPFTGKTTYSKRFYEDPTLALDYIIAPPQMAHYISVSTKVYETYLKYIAPEDIHVYSIDEVFINAAPYLGTYGKSAYDLAQLLIKEVLQNTGITSTAGIGSNLYLAKIAMDIEAKHIEADVDGIRIAELTEQSYKEKLWTHKPITDFWKIGGGYARQLESHGMFTMGDVARCSIINEELLYKLFGVNAELLIDHAWGIEPCTIADIKAYKPEGKSLSSGQVLHEPYPNDKALLVTKEMADLLALDLVEKGLFATQLVLSVGYDIENLQNSKIRNLYKGTIRVDHYGRTVPTPAHGSYNLSKPTASSKVLIAALTELFKKITLPYLSVRRISIAASVLTPEEIERNKSPQLDLFSDELEAEKKEEPKVDQEHEIKLQKAMLAIKKRFGKNSIIKGMNLEEGATGRQRNSQIGGHKA